MPSVCNRLHSQCAALGTRLFTVSIREIVGGRARRAYSSHPAVYPVSGTKPLIRDGWYTHCITRRQTFVANTAAEFARYFPDHALITSLGLGSCCNLPVISAGQVRGTVNLLAEDHHFTPAKLAAYHALITAHHTTLLAEMAKG